MPRISGEIMNIDENKSDSIKEAIKQKIKEKIKKELLEEIYTELKLEEELTEEITSKFIQKQPLEYNEEITPPTKIIEKKIISTQIEKESQKEVFISVKAILKVASHALKYANKKIPKEKWVEVIGLLAGEVDKNTKLLHIKDAFPIAHGNAIHVKMNDQRNRRTGFIKAYEEIKKNKLFICGWYHSHPNYTCFMSTEDLGTQARYQKHWNKSVALVIDPYLIDGTSAGFEIYRAELRTKTWYPLLYGIEGSLDIKMLPDILEFMSPIIEGKPAYLEYDGD